MRYRTIEERLDNYSIPEPMSGCVIWLGAANSTFGHGLISVGGEKGQDYAHRVVYERKFGLIPEGKFVLHTCDNSFCINPDHLYLGTQADNMRDVKLRGRGKGKHNHHGERHPSNKLNWDDVISIRQSVLPYKALMEKYGVCKSTISHIKTRRNWRTSP